VGEEVHGCAINCTVVPYSDMQDGWFMVQFLTRQQMEGYAREHSLLIKEQKE